MGTVKRLAEEVERGLKEALPKLRNTQIRDRPQFLSASPHRTIPATPALSASAVAPISPASPAAPARTPPTSRGMLGSRRQRRSTLGDCCRAESGAAAPREGLYVAVLASADLP